MAARSLIEWTDATWNPITGCSVVSPGCTHCYAMKLAGTRLRHHPSRAGLTYETKAGPVWNGQVRFNEEWLDQPLRWRKPRRIFVCAHGDLFHESVPDEWIDRVFAIMALAPQHTFQVLTKRAERMYKYLQQADISCAAPLGAAISRQKVNLPPEPRCYQWPLPNLWLGVSAEDQRWADKRIPPLLQTPAAVRFLSAEPLLGSLNLRVLNTDPFQSIDALNGTISYAGRGGAGGHESSWRALDWVIVGGESGPNARPMNLFGVRRLRDQCEAAGVPFFFKQWGDWAPNPELDFPIKVGKRKGGRLLDGRTHDAFPQAGGAA